MATIATNVLWANDPDTYFDFSYEKKREGSNQYYSITVSCRPVNGKSYFGYPIYVAISLDGSSKTSYTLKYASPSQWSSAITNTTGWLAVNNKTSGTTALAIRIYSGMGSSRDKTFTYNLAIDPAASTITCTEANIEGYPTITINRASSSFTHTVRYEFGTISPLKGTVATNTTATSITTWQIPDSFYAHIPNAKTGKGTLYCDTYSGSTLIGTSRCDLNVTTDREKCKPTVSGTVVDVNQTTLALTGNPNTLVRYASRARCTITATANKNAEKITQRTINNIPMFDTDTRLEITDVETGTFEFYAKDSREYFNSYQYACDLIPYIPLTCDVTAYRDDPTSGKATLKIEGNYFIGSFGNEYNNISVLYRPISSSEWFSASPTFGNNKYSATVSMTGLDYTKAHQFVVQVQDAISTIAKTVTIQKGIPVFDWGEKDFKFNVPVYMMNGAQLISFQGFYISQDINTVQDSGTYRIGGGTPNFPFQDGGTLVVLSCPNHCTIQFAFTFNANDIRVRSNWYGTWYDWKTFT